MPELCWPMSRVLSGDMSLCMFRRFTVCTTGMTQAYLRRNSGATQGMYTHAQVVVAIDDSRSMGENGCGSFALEAVTLICRAMARLEVGEMGVVSYGGSNSILPLHPLEKPFTDADGPGIMAQMKFSQVPCPPCFRDFLCPNVLLGKTGGLLQGPSSGFSQSKHGCMDSCKVTQHYATGLTLEERCSRVTLTLKASIASLDLSNACVLAKHICQVP